MTQLAPMMRYINRYMAYVDMNLRMASKTRALVRKDAGIDIEALADWENDIIEGNNITPDNITWMNTPPFNSMINQMMLQLETDLKQDSGANQFTRGETTGGIVSGKAINSLIQAGGKISSMRTEQIKYFFKDIVEQIIWLMAQFYDKDRVMMITGRNGQRRELKVDREKLFGESKGGAVNPPPYTVQIEISSRKFVGFGEIILVPVGLVPWSHFLKPADLSFVVIIIESFFIMVGVISIPEFQTVVAFTCFVLFFFIFDILFGRLIRCKQSTGRALVAKFIGIVPFREEVQRLAIH